MKKLLFLITVSMIFTDLHAQTYHDTIAWITVNNPSYYATEGELFTSDPTLNALLQSSGVVYYEKALPFAKNPELHKLHEVRASSDIDSLVSNLSESYSGIFMNPHKYEIPETRTLYDPADWQWANLSDNDTTNDWLWHLKTIDADRAWDVTLGDTSLVFAVLDYDVDSAHPDMQGQLLEHFDPYQTNINYDCSTWHNHGTVVAGFFSAETAETGTTPSGSYASIGFNTKFYFYEALTSRQTFLQKILHASNVKGAKVIVSSAGGALNSNSAASSLMEDDIVREILDNGTTIVMGAGNGPSGTHNPRPGDTIHTHQPFYPLHPSYDERIIMVTSTGVDDYHAFGTGTHSHYPEIDLCAPGYELGSCEPTNCGANSWPYGHPANGTSFSSPIVAGTASLMYSTNPCLNAHIVQDILKNTTEPIADASSFPGVIGTGRLNAGDAVEAAQGAYSSSLDLYIKDRPEDFGYPGSYAWGWWFDHSPDIWVRNQNDGFINRTHQEPEFSQNDTVYVYVKVWNKSCDSSYGAGNLSLYWSKASSSSSWPQNWDGTQPTTGDTIGSIPIPNLGPGEAKVFEFKWSILNPYVHNNWATCLLARIEGISSDPITVYPHHLEHDVFYNNNVALRNVTVVDITPFKELPVIEGQVYPHGRFMFIGNSTGNAQGYDITLSEKTNGESSTLAEESEIHIYTDAAGWSILEGHISTHPDIEIVGDKEFVVNSDSITLENISFGPGVRIPLYVGFNFLVDEITTENTYQYLVEQRVHNNSEHLTGSQLFVINKSPREVFEADAGADQIIRKYDSTDVHATDILEPALYNWYAPDGSLLYSGADAVLSPEHTTTYRLEVIAGSDGFKDYDEIVIEVQQYWLESLSPNPTNGLATIDFQIDGANSAYLMIFNSYGTINNNYILNPTVNQTNIDFSSYIPGMYSVVLVVNGQAADMKSLIVQ